MGSVEQLRDVIRQFNRQDLDVSVRAGLEVQLREYLDRPEAFPLALSVFRSESSDLDPQVAFYCAVLLEDVARKRFQELSLVDRRELLQTLLKNIVWARYPQFVTTKLVNVAVQFGKREMVAADPQQPEASLLHTALQFSSNVDSRNECAAGLELLSSLVQDSLDPLRSDLLSQDRLKYRAIVRAQASDIGRVLSKGLFHDDLRIAALCAEAVHALRTYQPHANDTTRTLQGLSNAYAQRGLSMEDLAQALEHLSTLLVEWQRKERGGGAAEGFVLWLLSMAEVLLGRNVVRCAADPALAGRLEKSLSALLEWTNTAQSATEFVAVLRCWAVVSERLGDALSNGDVEIVVAATAASERLRGGMLALAQRCLEKALFAFNAPVLESLEYWSEDENEELTHGDGTSAPGAVPDEAENAISERSSYIAKCLEVISDLGSIYSTEVRPAARSFAQETLRDPSRDWRDKLVALQLIADGAGGEDGALVASLVESIAVTCLDGPPSLRCAAYRAIASVVEALNTNHPLATSIAAAAAREASSRDPSLPLNVSIAAAELLSQMTTKICAPLFLKEPVGEQETTAVRSDVVAALLTETAFNVWLLTSIRSSTVGHSIGNAEWRERAGKFRSFLAIVLSEYGSLCNESNPLPTDWNVTLRIVSRASRVLQRLFGTARRELSGTKEGLWDCSSSFVTGGVSLLSRVGLNGDGRIAAELLQMLSAAFAKCRQFTGNLSQAAVDVAFRMVSASSPSTRAGARDRVLRALLRLVKAELQEIVPGEADLMIAPAVELCAKCMPGEMDPDVKVLAMEVLEEAICRHWRFFFPGDTSESYLAGNSTTTGADLARFNQAIEAVLGAFSCAESEVYCAGLKVLESANASRRLYTREAFQKGGAAAAVLTALFSSLLSRIHNAQQDRVTQILYSVSVANPAHFYSASLPELLYSQPYLTPDQRTHLHANFQTPQDSPSFLVAADALLNDLAYYHQLAAKA